MRITRDDIFKMIGEVNHQRSILEQVGVDLAARAAVAVEVGGMVQHRARLDPYSALLVSAEANLYRACVQLKEAYRQWERIRPQVEEIDREAFVDDSPYLVRSLSS